MFIVCLADKLQTLQNCAARVITKSNNDTRYNYYPLYALGWGQDLGQKGEKLKAITMFKALNKMASKAKILGSLSTRRRRF